MIFSTRALNRLLDENRRLREELDDPQRETKLHKAQVLKLQEELAQLRSQKKIEQQEIEHLVRLKQEKNEVEFEKRLARITKEKDQAIAKVKDDYRDKLEQRLAQEVESIKEMYGQILQRLPDINVKLRG